MTKLVFMLIICFVPTKDGQLKEAWRIEKTVPAQHCLEMSTLAGGGRAGAITVRCTP